MPTVRLPRKLKKRLISLNGRKPVRKCLIIARSLSEVLNKPIRQIQTLANVYPDGWAVKKGMAEPFEMKY